MLFRKTNYQVCRLNNGKLLWVNSTGLLYFDPRMLKETSSKHKYYIADINVNYNKVEIGEKINGTSYFGQTGTFNRPTDLELQQ